MVEVISFVGEPELGGAVSETVSTRDNSVRPEQMSKLFIIIACPAVVLECLHHQGTGLRLTLQELERQWIKKTKIRV